jgi:hypothetical protein
MTFLRLIRQLAIAAGLAAPASFFTGNASADWQGTAWNMTVEEADKNFRIPHHTLDRAERQGLLLSQDETPLGFTYATGFLDFGWGILRFHKEGKLSGIELKLKQPTQCDKLMEVLRRIYGKPAKDEALEFKNEKYNFGSVHKLTWYDEKNHNEVTVKYREYAPPIEPDCWLFYDPFIVPPPGSL